MQCVNLLISVSNKRSLEKSGSSGVTRYFELIFQRQNETKFSRLIHSLNFKHLDESNFIEKAMCILRPKEISKLTQHSVFEFWTAPTKRLWIWILCRLELSIQRNSTRAVSTNYDFHELCVEIFPFARGIVIIFCTFKIQSVSRFQLLLAPLIPQINFVPGWLKPSQRQLQKKFLRNLFFFTIRFSVRGSISNTKGKCKLSCFHVTKVFSFCEHKIVCT